MGPATEPHLPASGQLVPDPEEVASLVASLVASDWPTTEEERVAWFDRHGLDVADAERGWGADDAAVNGMGGVMLQIGGQPREALLRALAEAGVALNEHAETLLAHPEFDAPEARDVVVAMQRVEELGLPEGGTLAEVIGAARDLGLEPCPLIAGPYLRLTKMGQPEAPDPVLSAGRAPTGAILVVSEPISQDVEVPKGFYLRVVDGQRWLRGYRSDDTYAYGPEQVVALALRQPVP